MYADRCRRRECQSHTQVECISRRCYCCDLEDMLVALKRIDLELMNGRASA